MDFSLFDDDVEQGKHVHMEFYGNKGTFNMEAVLKVLCAASGPAFDLRPR